MGKCFLGNASCEIPNGKIIDIHIDINGVLGSMDRMNEGYSFSLFRDEFYIFFSCKMASLCICINNISVKMKLQRKTVT